MRIGDLARQSGVPDSTIRYYERKGLLRPAGRTEGNYRWYGREAVERLRFVRAAQASGLALHDIAVLLELPDGETSPCEEVRAIIETRLADVKNQMKHLHHVEQVLKRFREMCKGNAGDEECPVLEELTPKEEPKP